MRQNKRAVIFCIILGIFVTLSCKIPFVPSESPTSNSSGEFTLDPISIPSGQNATLGGMDGGSGEIFIPAGAYESETSAQLAYLEALPADPEQGWTGLGIPMTVSIESEQTRSDKPMQVTMQFDTQDVKEPGEVFVGYYHEQYGWYFFEPDAVDMTQSTLTFTTYHFSSYAGFQADEAKRIDQFLEKSATESFVRQTSQGQSQEQVEAMVKAIMEQGAGIKDDRVLEIITKAVVEQIPGGDMAIALHDMNTDALTQATMDATLSELGKLLSSDDSPLRELTDAGGTIGAFASASGHFTEGDYEEGLRIMADEIANNIPVISNVKKIGERAVELADEVITNVWFNPEIEKAFQVYKNGAEGGWFGYSVDARNWTALSTQMRGSFLKVQSDYVDSYCKARGIDPAGLSEEKRNQIADMGMDRLKSQFDERVSNQEQIDEIKANKQALMEMFAKQQLLIRDTVNPMYTGNEDLEMLMSRLLNMSEKILRDTGRSEIIFHSFDEDIDRPGTQIYGQQLAEIARIWYINREKSPEEAEAAYQQALIDMGLVEDDNMIYGVEPKKVSCTGTYTYSNTHLTEPVKTCSFSIPFSLEFWNVGAAGGAEYAGATFNWQYVDFKWADCKTSQIANKSTSGSFSGGPNGNTTVGCASIQLSAGEMGSLSYSDEDETMSGTCTISNPSAFAGWTGP